jgi:hypothetical protein
MLTMAAFVTSIFSLGVRTPSSTPITPQYYAFLIHLFILKVNEKALPCSKRPRFPHTPPPCSIIGPLLGHYSGVKDLLRIIWTVKDLHKCNQFVYLLMLLHGKKKSLLCGEAFGGDLDIQENAFLVVLFWIYTRPR